jgi:hypothetical protein
MAYKLCTSIYKLCTFIVFYILSISILLGMEKYYKPKSKNNENERSSHLSSGGGVLAQKKARVELSSSEVIADPGASQAN